MHEVRKRQFTFSSVYLAVALALMFALRFYVLDHAEPKPVPYSQLSREVRAGHVSKVEIRTDSIVAELKPVPPAPAKIVVASRLPNMDEREFVAELEKQGVSFEGHIDKVPWWEQILGWVLPLALL